MKAIIDLISPSGVPVALEVGADDDQAVIIATLERADKIGSYFAKKGWTFRAAEATGPGAAELDRGPTFAGYPCAVTVDDRGLPTWIMVDGKQAMRHEKQGDAWYSVKLADGTYSQVLRIPKGEAAPQVRGLDAGPRPGLGGANGKGAGRTDLDAAMERAAGRDV